MATARLTCIAGPREGEEFLLEDPEYVIGRAADNPICIPDTSVSRKHVMLRKVEQGWAVSDLGSGNGTLVNGEVIEDETPLVNGDVITLGDTELRFEDMSNATMMVPVAAVSRSRVQQAVVRPGTPPPRPPPRVEGGRARPARASAAAPVAPETQRRKSRLKLLFAAVLVVLLAGLVVVKLRMDQQNALLAQQALEQKAWREQLGALFQDAKNLVREGRWVEAKAKLEELQAQAPEYPGVVDYLKHAEREIPIQQHLADARAALAKNELGKASALLAKANDTQFLYEQVNVVRRELSEAADKRMREARTLLDSGQPANLDQAKAITDDVLAAFPEHRDGKLIQEQVAQAIALRDRPRPVVTGPAPKPWEPAVERFRDGDMSGAVAILNACMAKTAQCKKLLGQMTEFGNLYKRLEDLDAKGLTRLLALDRDITGGRGSKMARNAGTRAATIFYKSAATAKAAGQWARAMEYSGRALQADPGHTGAANIINELKTKARELYLLAYSIKDSSPEEALPKFKDVVAMTPSGDEYHEKAKSWVEKLSR